MSPISPWDDVSGVTWCGVRVLGVVWCQGVVLGCVLVEHSTPLTQEPSNVWVPDGHTAEV